jgi:hypothetical protein
MLNNRKEVEEKKNLPDPLNSGRKPGFHQENLFIKKER